MNDKKKDENEKITQTALKERGWTKSLIDKYFPQPCATRTNPFYKSAAPVKLYSLDKVIKIEKQEDFIENKKKSQERSQKAKKVSEKKEKETVQLIEDISIYVTKIPHNKIKKNAIAHYENWNDCIIEDEKEDFINRISVNYIRHNLTEYDDVIESLFRRVGKNKAYILLKNKTLDIIAEKYPYLRKECEKQKIT